MNQFFSRKRTLALLAALTLSLGAQSLSAEWTVDRKRSHLKFLADSRLHEAPGFFSNWWFNGTLTDNLEGSTGTVVVKTATINTGNESRDKHLRNEDFFFVEKFPYAVFKIEKVEPRGDLVIITGTIKIRDVTKPLRIEMKKIVKGDELILVSQNTFIKRMDFKMEYDSFLNPIKDQVRLDLELHLVKKK